MIKFNDDVRLILNTLTSNGFEAFVVGGAVRNFLLGIDPHDYDITTNATPNEIIKAFSFTKTILTGIKYGTVTVVYNNMHYEITTYRVDGEYDDNRHPINVEFSKTLYDDLKRRDFTINAMAYNDALIDFNNGLNDLKNKVVKCIGDPDKRFQEDALRILRAIRFACKLDFNIDSKTKESIFKNKELLKNISIERINSELFEIFKYKNIEIIDEYFELFMVIYPFISIQNTKQIINKINDLFNNNCDEKLIYSSFFMGVEEKNLNNIMNQYKLSNELKWIIKMTNSKNITLSNDEIEVRKLLKKYSKNDIIYYIKYNIIAKDECSKYVDLFTKLDRKCNRIKDLKINGNDLILLGISGNKIGDILDSLLDLVIEEKLENSKQVLIDFVKRKLI